MYLGYLLATLAAIMGYMNISEYLTTGYKMEEGIQFHIQQLMVGTFAGLFWFYILGGILLPILLVFSARTRTIKGIVVAAVLVIVAMWIERYLIIVAGFRVPLMAYLPENYSPSWVEWSILAGGFALFALIISVFAKLFPVVSIWEVVEHRGPEPGEERGAASGPPQARRFRQAPKTDAAVPQTPAPPASVTRRQTLQVLGTVALSVVVGPALLLQSRKKAAARGTESGGWDDRPAPAPLGDGHRPSLLRWLPVNRKAAAMHGGVYSGALRSAADGMDPGV